MSGAPMRWVIAVGLCVAGVARAQVPIAGYPDAVRAYDYREVQMLPGFCRYTQEFRDKLRDIDPETVAAWYKQLGDPFHHLHHYCWGMMKTNRGVLLARDSKTRNFYLADAITEFDYVIERMPEDFVLLPEILNRKGENLVRLGKGPVAVYQFERAIELKPDYWPPYAQLGDYYAEIGERQKAIETYDRGLAQAPDTPALKRRRADLQAKAPRPATAASGAVRR